MPQLVEVKATYPRPLQGADTLAPLELVASRSLPSSVAKGSSAGLERSEGSEMFIVNGRRYYTKAPAGRHVSVTTNSIN